MNNKSDLRNERDFVIIFVGLVAGGLALLCSGCSGVEVGGKFGVYRVDERQDSSRTHAKPLPWKCYLWADCSQQTVVSNGGMVEGS
jgi:hypothetical protein